MLTLLYAFLVLFLKRGWHKIALFTPSHKPAITKVSVLIAARNEADKIHLTIEDILAQNYPKHLFELIVVDDHSTDNTAHIIAQYATQGVKLIKLNESKALNSYKKKAITEAIATAQGDVIVTTDADCRMQPNWLITIINYYEQNGFKLISSPVVYFEEKTRFEKLQTLEFLYLIGLGAAGIGNGMPSTCNGANLAYSKKVFFELGGFKGIDDVASGDDELFLHKVAHAHPGSIGFCKLAEAIVYTHAKPNLAAFISQRKRWASKTVKYKDKKVLLLGLAIWLFNISLISNVCFGILYPPLWLLFAVQLMIKYTVEWLFLKPLTQFIQRRNLIYYLPLLTLAHIIYLVYIGVAGNWGKYNWKGRMVR
ncbi:MAG: glycosyltransferase [Sphingobacteriales bacterium]|nr:MAG: glycosyltransferase [Sphingobacteriales bacterium]TAF81477.1 MAG: glycosyltransferase [Sphingobacteriales bacterium]